MVYCQDNIQNFLHIFSKLTFIDLQSLKNKRIIIQYSLFGIFIEDSEEPRAIIIFICVRFTRFEFL